MPKSILCCYLLFCCMRFSYGQDTVRNVTAGNWSMEANWSNNTVPGANAIVILDHDLVIDINATCIKLISQGHSVIINSGIAFNVTGSALDTMLTTVAEAKPAFDNKSFGVYKGVFTSPSGTLKIAVQNESGVMIAYLASDNQKDTLTSEDAATIGKPISNIYFHGRTSNFYFSVDSTGTSPLVNNLQLDGSGLTSIILKEKSASLVKCFEGIVQGEDYGPFGALIQDTTIIAISQSAVYGAIYTIAGTVQNNVVFGRVTAGSDATFTGYINNNVCAGRWENATTNETGTWSGKRTL